MSVLNANMFEHDKFSSQLRELVVLEERMDWKDNEMITSSLIGVKNIADVMDLDIIVDPSHELRQSKEDAIKDDYRQERAECLRLYGTDERIQQMICTESNADLDRCLSRLDRGDFIREQIEVMNGMRKDKKMHEARSVCVWIFAQNGRYGVWYDEHLLQILKEFLADVNDQVPILKESCLKLHITFK
jgi:hypothetical protein